MSENFKTELFEAILSLKNSDECERFFSDLCTSREVIDLSARLRVAKLLASGVNYNDIASETGASTATISRVSKALSGDAGGYRRVLEREDGVADYSEKLSAYLSPLRVLELNLLSLFAKAGYEAVEIPSVTALSSLGAYLPEELVVFQNADGALLSLLPSGAAYVGSLCDTPPRLSYSAKAYKRVFGKICEINVLGAFIKGKPALAEKKELVSLAISALRMKNKNATLTLFNTKIIELVFKDYGLSLDAAEKLSAIINQGNEKQLLKLEAEGFVSPECAERLLFLMRLPQNAIDAITSLREAFYGDEYREIIEELSEIVASADKKRIKITAHASEFYGGLVFSSSKCSIFGKESENGIGFEMQI